jgi:hypothetical protein
MRLEEVPHVFVLSDVPRETHQCTNIFDNFRESLLSLLLAADAAEGKTLSRKERNNSCSLVLPTCFIGEEIQQFALKSEEFAIRPVYSVACAVCPSH